MILPPGTVLPPLEGPVAAPPPSDGVKARPARKSQASGPREHGDRFATINAFVDATMSTLPRAAALVWVALWRDERRGLARAAVSDLARRVGCNERTARRALATLKKRRLVEVVRRGRLHGGPSVYRLRVTGAL